MADSVFILTEKLKKAEAEIEVLRGLTSWTVAIIMAAGGRVVVPHELAEKRDHLQWRKESITGGDTTFEAWHPALTCDDRSAVERTQEVA
jgi:hypothetical protein